MRKDLLKWRFAQMRKEASGEWHLYLRERHERVIGFSMPLTHVKRTTTFMQKPGGWYPSVMSIINNCTGDAIMNGTGTSRHSSGIYTCG